MASKKQGGKKHRKYGRGTRSPSDKYYKAVDKASINKERRRIRYLKWQAKKRARLARRAEKVLERLAK